MMHGAPIQGLLCKENVGSQSPRKNLGSHIDASHSRQPLVKGERWVRYEVNAVMSINRSTQLTCATVWRLQCAFVLLMKPNTKHLTVVHQQPIASICCVFT